jgi:Neurotransmitter-gated ion-channel ligand binding domain
MFRTRALLMAAALCAIPSSAPAQTAVQGLRALPPGPRPVPVTIGAYLIDFEKIDESTLTHSLDGYLTLQWHDARLTREKLPPEIDRMAVTLDQIWSPNIEFRNQHEPRQVINSQLTIGDEGLVTYEERFQANLSTDFHLQRFPFDRQMLLMHIESFRYPSAEVVMVPRTGKALQSPDAFLPDWYILDVSQRIEPDDRNPDKHVYSMYTFDIYVQRKAGYYVWNVFLPLTFITLLAWGVFFVPPDDLQTRTGVSVTALLTAIAFSIVISGTRPRVSYLTFMDAIFLGSYFLIFLAAASVVIAHVLIKHTGNASAADRLSWYGRRLFPVLMAVAAIVLIIGFFAI